MRPAGRLFFWSYAYYLSKFYEFLDTVLLLVKAKPASFLHVFHHAVVVVMAWLWVDQAQTLQWGGLLTNTAVHVVMYWYYYETTLGNSPWWKKYITSFQIAQFSARCAPSPLPPLAGKRWLANAARGQPAAVDVGRVCACCAVPGMGCACFEGTGVAH